jgi:hypothetical protein
VSAEEDLFAVACMGARPERANALMNAYAHELAEKQRQGADRIYAAAMPLDPDLAEKALIAMTGIIDLIDPAVNTRG